MKDFEVTQVQAEAIRKSLVEHGGDLFFDRRGITIHLINHFPIVIGPAEEKGRQRVKRMTVITSEEIANEEWFKSYIEHEAQRKRMHREDNKRRRALTNALDNASDIFLHSADREL